MNEIETLKALVIKQAVEITQLRKQLKEVRNNVIQFRRKPHEL